MKERFEKHAQRLTEGEKELLWRQISAGNPQENRRRRQFWTTLGASGAVVAAALALMIAFSGEGPDRMTERVPLEASPRSEPARVATDEGGKAAGALEETAEPPREKKAAAPAAPENDPTVASPDARRRVAAAAPQKEKPGRSEPSAEHAEAPAEMTVLALTATVADSSESWVSTQAHGDVARIYGRVYDERTGEPLAFANVVLVGTNYGAMTLEDGRFEFLAPPGTYALEVSFLGYEPARIAALSAGEGIEDTESFAMNESVTLQLETVLVEGEAPEVDVKSASVEKKRDEVRVAGRQFDGPVTAAPLEDPNRFGRQDTDPEAMTLKDIQEGMALEAGIAMKRQPTGKAGAKEERSSIKAMYGAPAPRSEEERPRAIDDLEGLPAARRRGCWIPPHYNEPNGEPFDAMYFRHYGTNPFIVTEEDALSTFAVDVDEASYTLARNYLDRGQLPPAAAIRVEEFVNYFDAGYGRVRGNDFALRVDGAPSPFGDGYHLLRLGVQAKDVARRERKAANLVFVIDTSGSMNRENRLGLVKRALYILLDELDPRDTVGLVEYGSRGREILRPTSLEDRRRIERAIDSLQSNGSTNAEEGLDLGYAMASRNYDAGAINRIILCSDGVANTGETQAERILDRVRYESDRGIHLSAVGFGMGNYNDVLMEKLADRGDGNYHYVDRLQEAERVFRENLTGTLQTVARDAKIQVEFDPERVLRWRLLGYENRDVADEDFRNDAVDAGEIGAGHTVVALYELKLSDRAARALVGQRDDDSNRPLHLGDLRLRYEYPADHERAGEVVEMEAAISTARFSRAFDRADPHFRLAALAAEFAELLRGSYWARDGELDAVLGELGRLQDDASRLRGDETLRELRRLVERAERLRAREGGR